MKARLSVLVAVLVGMVVLAGYFVPLPLVQRFQQLFLDWGLTLLGVAALVGIVHLVAVHFRKVFLEKKKNLYSLILLLAFGGTLVYGLLVSPADEGFQKLVTYVQIPLESSLLAMVAISLAYVCLRILQRRKDGMALVFVVSVVVFLVTGSGFLALAADSDVARTVLMVVDRLPLAGGRGLLLGIALGSLTTGLRILMASERPYGE